MPDREPLETNGALATVKLVVSQLEAASTLLQFAADDLDMLKASARAPLSGQLAEIAGELARTGALLFERALYLERIDGSDLAPCAAAGPETPAYRTKSRRSAAG